MPKVDPCAEKCPVCRGMAKVRFVAGSGKIPQLGLKTNPLDPSFVGDTGEVRIARQDLIYHCCKVCGHEWVGLTWRTKQIQNGKS